MKDKHAILGYKSIIETQTLKKKIVLLLSLCVSIVSLFFIELSLSPVGIHQA